MKIKFRVLASGSNGNSAYLSTPDGTLLIDAGISRRRIVNELKSDKIAMESIIGVLVSHPHTDHCCGLPVLSSILDYTMYCSKGTNQGLKYFGNFDKRWHNICDNSIVFPSFNQKFELGPFNVTPLRTIHDTLDSSAFQISYRDINISIITDTGALTHEHQLAIIESDLVLLETNHDLEALYRSRRPSWLKKRIRESHLANTDAIEILDSVVESALKGLFFGHLSGECNSPDIVTREIIEWSGEQELPWNSYICRRDEPSQAIIYDGKKIVTNMKELKLSNLQELTTNKRTLIDHFS